MEKFLKDYRPPPPKKPKVSQEEKAKKAKKYEEDERVRVFQPNWLAKFDWLQHFQVNGVGRMYCKVCRKFDRTGIFVTGCTNYKMDTLKSHHTSESHKANLRKIVAATGAGPMDKKLLEMNSNDVEHLKILVRNAHFLATSGRPFTDFPPLCDLDAAKGLPIKSQYRNDKRAKEFVESIAAVEKLNLCTKLEEAKFLSVISDGATDSSHIEAEIVFVRLCVRGTVGVHFVAIKNVGKADAEGVTKAIEQSMNDTFDLSWKDKLVAIGTDGAAVMLGHKGGVIAKLRQHLEKPGLVGIHCSAHRLELAYKDATKSVKLYNSVALMLTNLYLFYRNSALNRSNLKLAFATKPEQTPLMPTRVSGTRWLPHTKRALDNLLRGYAFIVLHLTQVVLF